MTANLLPAPRIRVWTDGSARPTNPGFGGWAYIIDHLWAPDILAEFSWLPFGTTNNLAELLAIRQSLRGLRLTGRPRVAYPVVIYTDSQWAQRVIHGHYTARVHVEIIQGIRDAMNQIGDCQIRWVRGHAGNAWNETVDRMANLATYSRRNREVLLTPRNDFFSQAEKLLTHYEQLRAQS